MRGRAALIAAPRRRPATALVVAGLVGFGLLAIAVAGTSTATGFDTVVKNWLYGHVGAWAASVTLALSEPAMTTSVLIVIALGAALRRRWDVFAWAVVAPTLAIVLAEVVFKPVVGRRSLVDLTQNDPYHAAHRPPGFPAVIETTGYAYPSGHQTGVTAVTVELAVLVLCIPVGRGVRAAILALLALWTLVAAAGLVRNHYHFATDTVGAILLTAACVVGAALVTDAAVRRRRRSQLT